MPIEEKSSRELEEPHLKIGYHAMQAERWPMNKDIANCYNEDSAYYFHLEQTHLRIRPETSFDVLKDSIPAEHIERIEGIWVKLIAHKERLERKTRALRQYWANPPKNSDKKSKDLVQKSPIELQSTSRNAAMAIISDDPKLEVWKDTEETYRESVHTATKDFMTALRVYLEELIEKPKHGDQSVLPKDHPERDNIAIQKRYVQLLDATYMTVCTAKSITHEQPGRRVRKTEMKPAIFHPAAVTLSAIRHVMPFIIEKTKLEINPALIAIVAAAHDTPEDADMTVEEVVKKLKGKLDHYDVSIPVNSGFGVPREKFKQRVLDIMNAANTSKVRRSLRVLKTQEPLSEQEKKLAIEQNLAGRQKTMKVLDITDKDLARWGLKPTAEKPAEESPQLETFRRFDHAFDGGKLVKFIIKLHALVESKDTRQAILLAKIADRTNNIESQEKMPFFYQTTNLRATVSRLLAYCMLDHDNEEMPLYDALPYLIDITVKAYQRLAKESPRGLEPLDYELLAQAEKWQLEVIRLQLPQKTEEVLNRFKESKKRK